MAASPSSGYRVVLGFFRVLVRLFFREVQVTGLEHLPLDRGGVIVSWHPNGLVDPGLILTQFPRQVVFGARHGLFRWPVLGLLLRSIGTVPIYRAVDAATADPEKRRAQNKKTVDALAASVAAGSFAALFPEGVSHDEPHPVELKTGAARLYYRARALREAARPGAPPPVILPVGLHYDEKRLFRSRALVWFHAPIVLDAAPSGEPGSDLDATPAEDEPEAIAKERARRLTAEIERVLFDVVHATADWETHDLLHRGRKLLRAERAQRAGADPGRPGMGEKALGFARIRAGYYALTKREPARVAELRARVEQYDADMRALGLEDHELDRPPALLSARLATLLALQVVLVFLLVPPVMLFGYLVNGPTALGIVGLCRVAARYEKDEATIKLLVGAVAFPATWAGVAVLAALGHRQLHVLHPALPEGAGITAAFFAIIAALGGAVALRYLHVASETARAVRVRLTRARRRETLERLRAERAALADELLELARGLELPGVVGADGRIALR